jgi:hypothetical protein
MNPFSIRSGLRLLITKLHRSIFFLFCAAMLPAGAASLDNWHARSVPFIPADLYRVAYGNNSFVALGDYGTFLTSSNGVSWSKHPSPIPSEFMEGGSYSINYLNGVFFAAYADFDENWRLLTSANGIAWTNLTGLNLPFRLAFGNGVFAGIQGSALRFSTNGINWITVASDEYFAPAQITFGGGLFVVVGTEDFFDFGYSGVILSSPDGRSWTYERIQQDEEFYSIAYGNGRFVANGYFGNGDGFETNVMSSPDASNWTPQGRPDYLSYDGSLTFGAGTFLSSAHINTNDDLAILSSVDGEAWEVHDLGTDFNSPEGVSEFVFGNGTFVGVGPSSLLIQSDTITNGPPAAAAILGIQTYPGLTITGSFGRTYTIESTFDINATNSWQSVTNITLSTNPYLWIDTSSTGTARRFYRAVAH